MHDLPTVAHPWWLLTVLVAAAVGVLTSAWLWERLHQLRPRTQRRGRRDGYGDAGGRRRARHAPYAPTAATVTVHEIQTRLRREATRPPRQLRVRPRHIGDLPITPNRTGPARQNDDDKPAHDQY